MLMTGEDEEFSDSNYCCDYGCEEENKYDYDYVENDSRHFD